LRGAIAASGLRAAAAAAGSLCTALALLLLAGAAPGRAEAPAAAAPLTYAVSAQSAQRLRSSHHVAPVPPGFVGVSMDYCQISKYTGRTANPILAHLLVALAPTGPVIRIGGDELGTPCADGTLALAIDPPIIASLAHRTHGKLILGIDFYSQDATLVAPEVDALVDAIDPRHPSADIEAFEIGNEPDLYPFFGPLVPTPDTNPYFDKYLSAFTSWAGLIRAAARDPAMGIAGPSLGRFGLPWITGSHTSNFYAFAGGPAHPTLITFHTYPLLGQVPCPAQNCPSVTNLLSDHSSAGLAAGLAPFDNALGPGQQLRVDEMQSVTSGGVAGISNTFASALWVLETLFSYWHAGVSGVNLHTFPSARYALYSGPTRHGWLVYPEYYGMLAFEHAAPAGSRMLAVTPGSAARSAPDVKVWATRSRDGSVTDIVINRSTSPATVWLHGPGVPNRATARIGSLEGPPTGGVKGCPAADDASGLCATGGITLDGATFGRRDPAGGDHTSTGVLGAPAPDTCSALLVCTAQRRSSSWTVLQVAPASAEFLSGPPVPSRRGSVTGRIPARHG
jgi:hypothetical protein